MEGNASRFRQARHVIIADSGNNSHQGSQPAIANFKHTAEASNFIPAVRFLSQSTPSKKHVTGRKTTTRKELTIHKYETK